MLHRFCVSFGTMYFMCVCVWLGRNLIVFLTDIVRIFTGCMCMRVRVDEIVNIDSGQAIKLFFLRYIENIAMQSIAHTIWVIDHSVGHKNIFSMCKWKLYTHFTLGFMISTRIHSIQTFLFPSLFRSPPPTLFSFP